MRTVKRVLTNDNGSMPVMFGILLLPLILAVGFAVDYASASRTRSKMQDALDAASIAAARTRGMDDGARQARFQNDYTANGGVGSASLTATFKPDGAVSISSSASFDMPTAFMAIASIDKVNIGVAAAVGQKPVLVSAGFEVNSVKGWWNKTLWLYSRTSDPNKPIPLLKIAYTFNEKTNGPDDGQGTTIVSKITTDAQGRSVETEIMRNTCESALASQCKKTFTGASGFVDVSKNQNLYLQMSIDKGKHANINRSAPTTLRSDDTATSNRMFYGSKLDADGKLMTPGKQVQTGSTFDLYNSVPCGQSQVQSWEDGGTTTAYSDADTDFRYTVTGRCDTTGDPRTVVLTR